MSNEDHIIITAAKPKKRKQKKRLYSLGELAHTTLEDLPKPKKVKKVRSPWKRYLLITVCILLSPFVIVGTGLLYITSPFSEQTLTRLVTNAVNDFGKPIDLRVHIGNLSGFWQGEVKLYDVRIHDKFGPWLYVEEGTVHPDWKSLARATLALMQYQQTGVVADYLYNDAKPLSSIKQQSDTFSADAASSYTKADYNKHLQKNTLPDELDTPQKNITQESAPSTTNISAFEVQSFKKKSLPAAAVAVTTEDTESLVNAKQILENKVTVGLKLGTLLGVRLPRAPRYLASVKKSEEIVQSSALSLMPPWLAIDVGEIELANFQLGPTGRDMYIAARFQGQANATQARLRCTLLGEKTRSGQWVLPELQDLPGDVTLTMKQLRGEGGNISRQMRSETREFFAEKKILSFISLDYDNGDADLRMQWRDTIIGPALFEGISGAWSRLRILARMPLWPPTKDEPLQVQFTSRFGLSFADNTPRIKASLASAQFFWDGSRIVLRDANVISPIKKPNIELKGSMGFDPEKSFGTQIKLSVKDIALFASLLDIEPTLSPVSGAIDANIYITRGGDLLLWWTKPLPSIQIGRDLPGFFAAPYDYSKLAKELRIAIQAAWKSIRNIDTYVSNPPAPKISRLPMASAKDDALQMRIKISSPKLQLPTGEVKDVFFSIDAKSVEALKAPSGTAYKSKEDAANYANVEADNPNKKLSTDADFTPLGLPRGLAGTSFMRIGNMHEMGKGSMSFNWFLGGLHEEARTLQLEFEEFALNMPGINGFADIGFAYALPMKYRNWPWIDGTFHIDVEHWKWLGIVTQSNIRGNSIIVSSELKSFLDEDGKPQQYLNAGLQAERLDSTQFIVRGIDGTAESKNLHALADILALSTGKLREALEKKLVYTASPDKVLLNSKLRLNAGRSGDFNWNRGDFNLNIINEDANFTARMQGDISAVLNGVYNFRKRVVSLKQMQFLNN